MKKDNKTNQNEVIIIFGFIVILALIIGVVNIRSLSDEVKTLSERVTALENGNGGSDNGGAQTQGYDVSLFKQIKVSEIEADSKGKTIVVWLGLPTCGYCQAYAPLLAEVADDFGITARYIDVSTMTEDEFDALFNIKGKGDYAEFAKSFTGTPFTMIIKDNKIIGGINGYTDTQYIEQAFKEAGLKK